MSAIETVMKACADKSMVRHKKQSLDLFSASAIKAVYEAVNDANKAKLAAIAEKSLIHCASICFKFVSPKGA